METIKCLTKLHWHKISKQNLSKKVEMRRVSINFILKNPITYSRHFTYRFDYVKDVKQT